MQSWYVKLSKILSSMFVIGDFALQLHKTHKKLLFYYLNACNIFCIPAIPMGLRKKEYYADNLLKFVYNNNLIIL